MYSLSRYKVGGSIAVSDIERARAFYEGVLGLRVGTDTAGNVAYACADDSTITIFVSPHAGTARSTQAGWAVDHMDTAVEALTAQGVEFEQYDDEPIITDARGVATFDGGNQVAYFTDPDGNVLSIAYAPADHESPWAGARVATRLPCQDLERARAWYRDALGLEPAEARDGGYLYTFGVTSFALFGTSGTPSGTHTQMAIDVPDIERTVAALRERGVQLMDVDVPGLETRDGVAEVDGNYPSKGRGERAAWFHDSEGNLIGIGQPVP